MVKILEVDQWTSTGNVAAFSMEQWEKDLVGTLLKVKGGDSEAAFKIFGGHAKVKQVNEDHYPDISYVWYREENGKLKKWRWCYDSSD
jgi:hypothetical protein